MGKVSYLFLAARGAGLRRATRCLPGLDLRPHATLQKAGAGHGPVELDQPRDDTGPAGLVTCPDAGPVVTMKVFVEKEVVAPVGARIEFLHAAEDRTLVAWGEATGSNPVCCLAHE